MRIAAEQSYVPVVFTRSTVGTPALATVFRGQYPPFALISIVCTLSVTVTFCAGADGVLEESLEFPLSTMNSVPEMMIAATMIEKGVDFITNELLVY